MTYKQEQIEDTKRIIKELEEKLKIAETEQEKQDIERMIEEWEVRLDRLIERVFE